jgi:hypothetical protein
LLPLIEPVEETDMCPMCWISALTAFGGIGTLSVITVIARDRWILAVAVAMGILLAANRLNYVGVPWWCLAILIAIMAGRFLALMIGRNKRSFSSGIWRQALHRSKRTCPRRHISIEQR